MPGGGEAGHGLLPDAAALAADGAAVLPNVYEKLEALPHNANGKLDRAALKERFLHAQS